MTRYLTAVLFAAFIIFNSQAKAKETYGTFSVTSFSQKTRTFLEDVSGSGPSFGFGYHISKMLSAEVSFSNLEYEDDYVMDIARVSDNEHGTLSISGDVEVIDYTLLIRRKTDIPRPHMSPYLMVGLMDFDASDSLADIDYPNDPNGFRRARGVDESETYFGFGIDLLPEMNGLGFRLNYKVVGGDVDADFISAGLIFDF